MRVVITFLVFSLCASVTAFSISQPLAGSVLRSSFRSRNKKDSFVSSRYMFSTDDDTNRSSVTTPLKTVEEEQQSISANRMMDSSESMRTGTVVKDMNTGKVREVKWVDPAMAANTNPFIMSPWGYFFFFPFVLILNDFFHFLPTEGPLAFLNQI